MKLHITLFSYGGIVPETHDSVLMELLDLASNPEVTVGYSRTGDDALIERSRSRAASKFLIETEADVMVMVDHDLQWRRGDLLALAEKALETKGVVAGLYSYRAAQRGFASRLFKEQVELTMGEDKLHEAQYLATGFMALPRSVLSRICADYTPKGGGLLNHPDPDLRVRKCAADLTGSVYYDLFRCVTIPSDMVPGAHELISEDWALCLRARAVGAKCWLYTKPDLTHYGMHDYRVTP